MIEWWLRSVAWCLEPARLTALASLLSAVAASLWPALFLWAIFHFRRELRRLLPRLRRGKFLGQELELADEIDQVQRTVGAVSGEVEQTVADVTPDTTPAP